MTVTESEGVIAMTDRELKKLNRRDLMQLLLDQSKQMQDLRTRLAATEAALQDKTLKISQAGSIAQAALQLNGVFEAAEAACQQYTLNMQKLSQEQDVIRARMEEENRAKADAILAQAQQEKEEMRRKTQAECDAMLAQAREASQQYWDDVATKLQMLTNTGADLQCLLNARE